MWAYSSRGADLFIRIIFAGLILLTHMKIKEGQIVGSMRTILLSSLEGVADSPPEGRLSILLLRSTFSSNSVILSTHLELNNRTSTIGF